MKNIAFFLLGRASQGYFHRILKLLIDFFVFLYYNIRTIIAPHIAIPYNKRKQGVVMFNLYTICAGKFSAFLKACWEYSKNHLFFTVISAFCILLCLIAVVLLMIKSVKMSAVRKEAENANAFLDAMEKEHAAKERALQEEKAKAEEEQRKKEAHKQQKRELSEAEKSAPKKCCLFCGTLNGAHADFCEECAGKEFGSLKDYFERKERMESDREKKQAARAAVKEAEKELGVSRAVKYTGKWVIYRVYTDVDTDDESYFFELHASNGEKLLTSEEYSSYVGALKGIQTHKFNILHSNFRITLTKKGTYMFKLLSGRNSLLCMGENYPTKARCESAIESTKRFAETAVIDEDLQELLVKLPTEDASAMPIFPDGVSGKWVVSHKADADGETMFFFELHANNGEKLLSSEEYTTYIGAINGVTTHRKNIETGNFRVSLTKRGDYIVKLLNGNGQLLCLGEHYKSRSLCNHAIESIKRFALSSPVLTDAETAAIIKNE